MKSNTKKCTCGNEFIQYKTTDRICVSCRISQAKSKTKSYKPIPKVSEKRKIQDAQYKVLRKEFLEKEENKICFIEGCNRESNTIEHKNGRWGTNYLDVTTWAGCCIQHNLELENNPELSKKYQNSKITGKPKNL